MVKSDTLSAGLREVEHGIDVDAPAEAVYALIADVAAWPRLFPPTVHVEHVERSADATEEVIQIWATANGEAKTWRSRRELNPAERTIRFRQVVSQPPIAAMGGTWIIEPRDGGCRVRLLHDYRAVEGDPRGLAWIDEAVDRNSAKELAALKANAELAAGRADLLLEFTDSVRIDGSAAHAYEFIDRADQWQRRLPHVARVRLEEDAPGLQVLEMDTHAKDGSTHTTRSVRVCLPEARTITYKQTVLPGLMALHTGRWAFVEDGDGVIASSQHTVIVKEDAITAILGQDAGVAQAREYLRAALGANSRATLGHAKAYAEGLRADARR
ncbi:aromatase/cyclase [Actinokineospora sp. G85]|uniref:aromatase/cyclase n=1 Tax=Actinokineospora sp. G85 TaxID=3406626 RepID=UPI003C741D5B